MFTERAIIQKKIEVMQAGDPNHPVLVRIEGQEYIGLRSDPNTILVPEEIACELLLKDLPNEIALTPCKRLVINEPFEIFPEGPYTEPPPVVPSQYEGVAPFRIYYAGKGKAGVIFHWHCSKNFWKDGLGYQWKLRKARAAVLARRKRLGGIRFHRFVDLDYIAGVEFAAMIDANTVESTIHAAYELADQILSIIDEAIAPKAQSVVSESIFTKDVVIPLLKKMGFQNVMYSHGAREFGRDLIFSIKSELGGVEFWAAQVKLGDVSGRANSYVDLIINQAEEAFRMPFYDVYTKNRYRISKFLVIISGRFTDNAIEKICGKIESHALRNNLVFLDGEKIQALSQS